ncbi:MAG: hypothetical protein IPM13_08085 [Phycisphaerales bacterium]|nr:hypothetical protein [Phycisphaerales bacterium]
MSRGKASETARGAAAAALAVAALLLVSPARAGYWIAYEGDDFPENVGWQRIYGNAQGPGQGGTPRWIESGQLVYDSYQAYFSYDFARLDRQIDPAPGEMFVAEWRVYVESSEQFGDNGITFARDGQGTLGIQHRFDSIRSSREEWVLPVTPGLPHDFRIESGDMMNYALFIDGVYARSGVWDLISVNQSFVAFGDGRQSVASVSRTSWDFVRFGAIPEPVGIGMLLFALASRASVVARR